MFTRYMAENGIPKMRMASNHLSVWIDAEAKCQTPNAHVQIESKLNSLICLKREIGILIKIYDKINLIGLTAISKSKTSTDNNLSIIYIQCVRLMGA